MRGSGMVRRGDNIRVWFSYLPIDLRLVRMMFITSTLALANPTR